MALTLKPIDIYAAYPGADMIDLPAPVETDTFEYYTTIVGRDSFLSCGDTLYAFLFFEISQAASDEEALRMIRTAINDLRAIENKIQEIINVRS